MAKEKFSGGDIVAIILAVTLCLVLLVTTIALLVFDNELSESGGRLLTTIGAGLVGALSVYVGRSVGRYMNGRKPDEDQ